MQSRYPLLSNTTLRDLKETGWTSLPVLSEAEVILTLGILTEHLMRVCKHHDPIDIACPRFASNSVGQQIRESKELRILEGRYKNDFLLLPGVKELTRNFEGFFLSSVTFGDLVSEDRSEVYFRVVRPHELADVGGFHRDHWFNELYTPNIKHLSNFKVWIPLICSPESGLEFIPRQHDIGASYTIKYTKNGPRPVLKGSIESRNVSIIRPKVTAGRALVFDPHILHRGAINRGPKNRVSLELCFFDSVA